MSYVANNHQLLAPRVYADLTNVGISMPSRNGPVLRLPGVNTLVALKPWQRVNTCPVRDANPFFHLMEAMAMLAPFNSVEFLSYFAKNMANYSDNGVEYNAFYGTRIRTLWGDQLVEVIDELKTKPESRQAVCQLWDPADLRRVTKDKACNMSLVFSVNHLGELEMCSFNRSNDAIWGILSGANVVHLSIFQEYVACALGRRIGPWSHVSANLHVYVENPLWEKLREAPALDHYQSTNVLGRHPHVLFSEPGDRFKFDMQVRRFLGLAMDAIRRGPESTPFVLHEFYNHHDTLPFVKDVVIPVFLAAYNRRTKKDPALAYAWCHRILAPDWHAACMGWLTRRSSKEVAS